MSRFYFTQAFLTGDRSNTCSSLSEGAGKVRDTGKVTGDILQKDRLPSVREEGTARRSVCMSTQTQCLPSRQGDGRSKKCLGFNNLKKTPGGVWGLLYLAVACEWRWGDVHVAAHVAVIVHHSV